MRTPAIVSFVLGSFVVVAACGGGQPEPATPPASGAEVSPPPAAPTGEAPAAPPAATAAPEAAVPAAWGPNLTKEEQSAFMKAKVVPPMSKVFKEHDAKKYAEFDCKTCHGPQYQEPKEFLPKLVMKGGKITAFAEKPAISKWMNDKVVPEMAAAMGQKPYDPATKTGFGCGGCHAVEMK